MKKFCDFWGKAFKESSLLRNFIVMVTGVAIAFLFALPFGINEVVDFITSTIIIMIITQIVGDVWFKVTREPELLCWQYAVGVIGVLVSDWMFLWASKSCTFPSMFLRLGVCVALSVATGLWFDLGYGKVAAAHKDASFAKLKTFWLEQGVSEEVIEKTFKEM